MPRLVRSIPFAGSTSPVEQWRFDNGLTLLLHEDRQAPVFAYQTWFDVGSADEAPGKTGMAHLFEHLLFRATKTLSDGEFDRILEARGGSTNAATWVDWTYYTSGLPAEAGNLELVALLEADRMANLRLDDSQVESEREVVLNERRYRVDDLPDGTLSEMLYAAAFERHPYGWPTIGWERDIRAIRREDCLDFYRVWYAPNNATLVVVGNVEGAAVRETIDRHYGGIAAQPIPPRRFAVEGPPAGRRREVRLPIENEKLVIGYPGPALGEPDRAALLVLELTAFGGNSARLRRRLVDDLAIAAEVESSLTPFRHPGLFEVTIEIRPGHAAADAERVLEEELARLRDADLSGDELEKARNQAELGLFASMRTAAEKAELLGSWAVTTGDAGRLLEEVDRIRAVGAEDVRRVARRWLGARRATVVARPEEGE